MSSLILLKLGGSLITDKTRPFTVRLDILRNLSDQIATTLKNNPDFRLIIGHGSGSFGHTIANKFNTRQCVNGLEGWHGFAEVWYQASLLNLLVVKALRHAGIPAVTISPFSSVNGMDGQVASWNLDFLKSALTNGLLPIIHGDVVFDKVLGGTILSTEELFAYLASKLNPSRILLAGLEEGVWRDFPNRMHLIEEITPRNSTRLISKLGFSSSTDVTGGMISKVVGMLALVKKLPRLEVLIFSGEKPSAIHRTLLGENLGTCIHS
jgi:isopentenyl phosphate kinase